LFDGLETDIMLMEPVSEAFNPLGIGCGSSPRLADGKDVI
jgi:hypothetical protein